MERRRRRGGSGTKTIREDRQILSLYIWNRVYILRVACHYLLFSSFTPVCVAVELILFSTDSNLLCRLVRIGLPEIGRKYDHSTAIDGRTRTIDVSKVRAAVSALCPVYSLLCPLYSVLYALCCLLSTIYPLLSIFFFLLSTL